MHEAGLVADALASALAAAPAGRVQRVVLEVADPVELSVDALLMHLHIALSGRGLAGVPVAVRVAPVRCPACASEATPQLGQAFCAACGWPLPRVDGVPVRIKAATS